MQVRSNWIAPILKLLSENLDSVLPAVGGAMEDLEHPDIDELEDMLINRETREVTDFLETPTPTINNLYRPAQPIFRSERHFYRYFIDGSLPTYYLATGIESNRSFPVELAQIGCTSSFRTDCKVFTSYLARSRMFLKMPG
jgi:hypothetical protein